MPVSKRRAGARTSADNIYALFRDREELSIKEASELTGISIPLVRRIVREPNFVPTNDQGPWPVYWRLREKQKGGK